jgi:hypothetical protein
VEPLVEVDPLVEVGSLVDADPLVEPASEDDVELPGGGPSLPPEPPPDQDPPLDMMGLLRARPLL